MSDRTYRCKASTHGVPCQWEGDNEAAGAHMRETGHKRCICCYQFLDNAERQTCNRCIANSRADLLEIVEHVALAPEVIEAGGYRGILVDLLAHIADGAIESPRQQLAPPDIKADYLDAEWPSDPWPVLAVLEAIERTWRHEFDHGPATVVATVSSCAAYLTEWLHRAATTFAGFDDDAATLKTLASRLRHATGRANDPQTGVRCLDCPDVKLERVYNEPILPVPDRRRSHDGKRGLDGEGKADCYACPSCRRTYDWRDYGKAVHHYAAGIEGWVKIADGAVAVGREPKQVWRWINDGRLAVACLIVGKDRRARVWLDDLRELDQHARKWAATRPASLLDFASAS